jgi:beta-N-acetylhexosaminidase
MKAAIVGLGGLALSPDEEALLRAHRPAGVILFARNIESPGQLRALVHSVRTVLPADALLMIDQEGGRVARLRSPHWGDHPPAEAIGRLFDADPGLGTRAAWITGALIGLDCARAGFDVACAPVLDLRHPGASEVIGDRAFSGQPGAVARLGRALAQGLLAAGIQPVGKHAPGHGRAGVDSHLELPRVEASDLEADLIPFVLNTDLPWFMTAHILYTAWDAERPATLSPLVLEGIVRRRIGFEGVLVSDDLAMRALTGAPASLALQALAAGCDLALYCAGDIEPTEALLSDCAPVSDAALARLAAARRLARTRRVPLDGNALAAERDRLLA